MESKYFFIVMPLENGALTVSEGEPEKIFLSGSSDIFRFSSTVLVGVFLLFLSILGHSVQGQTRSFLLTVHQPSPDECSVNLNENEGTENFFSLFPNPSQGTVFINCQNFSEESCVKMEVYSCDGRLVNSFQENLNGSNDLKTIDLTGLKKGIYLLRITGQNILWNTRFIIH